MLNLTTRRLSDCKTADSPGLANSFGLLIRLLKRLVWRPLEKQLTDHPKIPNRIKTPNITIASMSSVTGITRFAKRGMASLNTQIDPAFNTRPLFGAPRIDNRR